MTLLDLVHRVFSPTCLNPTTPRSPDPPKIGLDKSHMYTAVDQRPIPTYVSDKGLGTGVGWPNLVTH